MKTLLQTTCLAAALLAGTARGELFLTNYSLAKPLKVLGIGDSITDDCVTNGAWRAHLQPLLDNGGIVFTNLGRYSSAAASGFSKRRHEGFCGSVIAAPGVFGPIHGYASEDNYLLRTERDTLAIPLNRPDLALVLIGANDLGRGRNPWTVATNDMPKLLDLIYSNVPTAHVILAKPTTLQNASSGYGDFATNVPIYSAALQAYVNQRQAAGVKVLLADTFSVVDYATMFASDHLHPNTAGLQAIAREFALRIQTISVSTNQYTATLINGGAFWRYLDTGAEADAGWTQPGFDDSTWSLGLARLGYGDLTVATPISYGGDPMAKPITTRVRRPFVVPPSVALTNLQLRLAKADGAAVYLNGQEIFRANLPPGPLGATNLALSRLTGYAPYIFQPTNLSPAGVLTGTNWLAVEVHLSSSTNAVMGFDLELIAQGQRLAPPTLTLTRASGQVQLAWPVAAGAGYSLYAATQLGLAANWTPVTTAPQTNGSQAMVNQPIEAATTYYRLRAQ